jgi:small redox-active disulfide protein 2
MFLFGKKDKKETPQKTQNSENNSEIVIKILGSGCANCNALEKAAMEAVSQMGINVKVNHVTDFSKIASYGVMSTPALVINEKVVSSGKVLTASEVKKILEKI